MWPDLPTPVIIAHRGDSAHAPENTLSAFVMAAEKGADAIEFDVKLTADGQVIVIHDQTVDRTTNGHGDVRRLPLAALRDLDAGARFEARFSGERIPTLDEVFKAVGKRLHMNIELTNYATPSDSLVAKVVELVVKYDMQDRVLFSSFFPRNLRRVRSLLPETPRGLLAWAGWLGFPARTFGWRRDYYALHPHLSNVDAGLVSRLHAAGKRLHVWTVNAEEDMKHMIALGVDGIFTDDPALLSRCLGRAT
ncbi:MAG: glycerophosphodiester phosphodiesterase family protein [Chloroflexota bacterium]